MLLLLTIAAAAAIYYCIRFYSLKKSINAANKELKEIVENFEGNRIIKLAEPNRELEELLITINNSMEAIRQKIVFYAQREKELKNEIENISHDLRTPLTSILGYLKIIDNEKLSDDDSESLETVKRKADFLQRLISQFYDLSRLSGGDYKLVMEYADVARMLKQLIMNQYKFLTERNLNITIEIPDKPILSLVDVSALERVFVNLLQNAGKYAKSTLNILLKINKERLFVIFENDTDKVEEENVNMLFKRFYTSDSSRSGKNTGLGLTISKHLAENMGGKLYAELESKDDKHWLKIVFEIQCHFE